MTDSFELNSTKKVSKILVNLEGLKRINSKCILGELEGLKNVSNVKDLFVELQKIHKRFDSFDIFKQSISELHCGKRKGEVNVNFRFIEKTFDYSIATNVNQKGNASLDFEASFPAVFSNLNTVKLSASVLGASSFEYAAKLLIPRFPFLRDYRGSFNLFKYDIDMNKYASYLLNESGCSFGISDQLGRHAFSWEFSLRDIMPSLNEYRLASSTILNSPMRSLKNSLKFVYNNDSLNKSIFPTKGTLSQAAIELCLPGGDVKFLKSEFHKFFAFSFSSLWTLHASVAGGGMMSFNKEGTCIQDRFYIGGASGAHRVLRGFSFNGIGCCDIARSNQNSLKSSKILYDYLGGDAYINSQLSISRAIPIKNKQLPVPRIFAFANAGNVIESLNASCLKNLISGIRSSFGLGVSLPFPIGGWLEFIAALSLFSKHTDSVNKFQIGIHLRSSPM